MAKQCHQFALSSPSLGLQTFVAPAKIPRISSTFFNPFILRGLFYLNSLDQSISNLKGVWSVLIISMFIEMPVVNANSTDPDQKPHSAASVLGLPESHLWDDRHKWIKHLSDP